MNFQKIALIEAWWMAFQLSRNPKRMKRSSLRSGSHTNRYSMTVKYSRALQKLWWKKKKNVIKHIEVFVSMSFLFFHQLCRHRWVYALEKKYWFEFNTLHQSFFRFSQKVNISFQCRSFTHKQIRLIDR